MAKYFLGSVGSVEAFERQDDGSYRVAFVSKTLTDSGINTTISKEDIRGGTGAPIQFSFYHDPAVEINLTDVVFKPEYLEAQLGTEFAKTENSHSYASEEVTAEEARKGEGDRSGVLYLSGKPIAIEFGPCGGKINKVWATKRGKDEWKMYDYKLEVQEDPLPSLVAVESPDFAEGDVYCVRYCQDDDKAMIAEVTSEIIPAEYMLIITAPIFAGDACAASNGKKAGTITYEIPRFRLNGGSEMAFNMSSNQTLNLAGSAYATEGCDMEGQTLYKVVLKLDGYSDRLDMESLVADPDYAKEGSTPVIYAVFKNGKVRRVANNEVIFVPQLDGKGKFKKGSDNTQNFTLIANHKITGTFTYGA